MGGQSGAHNEVQTNRGARGQHQEVQLDANALGRNDGDSLGHRRGGRFNLLIDLELKAGGEPCGPEHAQGIVTKQDGRVNRGSQPLGVEVTQPVGRLNELGLQ